jgi:hypothetical protein
MDSYNADLFASINDYITKTLTDAGVSFEIFSRKHPRHRHFLARMPDDGHAISVESRKDGTVDVKNEEHEDSFESFDEDSLLKLISRGIILKPAETPTKRKAEDEDDAPVIKCQHVAEEEQDSPESPPVEPASEVV